MNGIIHACSHPNDSDSTFRISEAQIFRSVFSYIDHLFAKVKPRRLFFLAVDGVAPRAKMNQQRSRRFRSALDAENARQKAIDSGVEMPDADPFDSNCITPGTPFMARLHEQLKYFITKKISEDAAWHGVQIVLSGHDVPGEGEHKIMEYIRLAKSRADYPSDVRHCLYGLDADLMMLGLLSHEPHFSLLREEVKFGSRGSSGSSSKSANPESINFYLLHLSLFREYLDLEFASLKELLPFKYDLERIIDDYILLNFFVGNDFLPSLPDLHIRDGALNVVFEIYKRVLPNAGGYINDAGVLNLERCQLIFDELAKDEMDRFRKARPDIGASSITSSPAQKGRKGKQKQSQPASTPTSSMQITASQKSIFVEVHNFAIAPRTEDGLALDASNMSMPDREFAMKLATELGFDYNVDISHMDDGSVAYFIEVNWKEDDEEDDEESFLARKRVLRKYENAIVQDDNSAPTDGTGNSETNGVSSAEQQFQTEFALDRDQYYHEKMGLFAKDSAAQRQVVYHYVEGMQWVLFYYYRGVQSWSWFYPYHYTPKINDLVNIAEFKFNFERGHPFLPFEQLMGVLPGRSRMLLPPALRPLFDEGSPIADFYPHDFELDMAGKKSEWEAVVKIPFIDEKRLLAALQPRYKLLNQEERSRNSFGDPLLFVFDANMDETTYPSSLPGVFGDVTHCHVRMTPYKLPEIGEDGYRHALCPAARTGENMLPGFPSLKTIPHTATLGMHQVNVFNSPSSSDSMVITIRDVYENETNMDELALKLIGSQVFVKWPFLREAQVMQIADDMFVYTLDGNASQQPHASRQRHQLMKRPHTESTHREFVDNSEKSQSLYSIRYATLIGEVSVVVYVRLVVGMNLLHDGSIVKSLAQHPIGVALQTLVVGSQYEDPRLKNKPVPSLELEFPLKSTVFLLSSKMYGASAVVLGHQQSVGRLEILVNVPSTMLLLQQHASEPNGSVVHPLTFAKTLVTNEGSVKYFPSWMVAKQLGLTPLALSKITSKMHIVSTASHQRFDIGLNLKFDSRNLKVLGYSRKVDRGWEFSQRAVDLLMEYRSAFPSLFQGLSRKAETDMMVDTDLFGLQCTHDQLAEKTNAVKTWLKEKGVREFVRVPLATVALSKECVMSICAAVDKLNQSLVESAENEDGSAASSGSVATRKQIRVRDVPRQALLKPAHSKFRLERQKFELGDRVCSTVDERTSVPLGAMATIVGVESGMWLELLLDEPVMGGGDLDGRCPPGRGVVVHRTTCLNLTTPQPPMTPDAERGQAATMPTPAERRPASMPSDKPNAWNTNSSIVRAPIQPSHPNASQRPRSAVDPSQHQKQPQQTASNAWQQRPNVPPSQQSPNASKQREFPKDWRATNKHQEQQPPRVQSQPISIQQNSSGAAQFTSSGINHQLRDMTNALKNQLQIGGNVGASAQQQPAMQQPYFMGHAPLQNYYVPPQMQYPVPQYPMPNMQMPASNPSAPNVSNASAPVNTEASMQLQMLLGMHGSAQQQPQQTPSNSDGQNAQQTTRGGGHHHRGRGRGGRGNGRGRGNYRGS